MKASSRAWLITAHAPGQVYSGFESIASQDIIIAVDGGLELCLEKGLEVDYLCGDLDSVRPELVAQLPPERIWRFNANKNETDTELAILNCIRLGISEMVILNDMGGRVDHALGLIQNLLFAHLQQVSIRLETQDQQIFFLPEFWEARGLQGCLLSLLAHNEEAVFAMSEGLKWDLSKLSLRPGLSRGISNEIISDYVCIHKSLGQVLAVLTKIG